MHSTSTDNQRVKVTVAYSTLAGGTVMDTALDVRGSSDAHLVTGRLNQKDVIVVWGNQIEGYGNRPWLRVYDGTTAASLPSVGVGRPRDAITAVWTANGRAWLELSAVSYCPGPPESSAQATVWQFDGANWVKYADVGGGSLLAPVEQDGTLWTFGQEISRFDAPGRAQVVPFLTHMEPSLIVRAIHAAGPDDIWLVAIEREESLLFRTKKMTSVCRAMNRTELSNHARQPKR